MNLDIDNIFYQCAVDNLESLKETIIDLLKKDYNPKEIKIKLRDLEFDMKKNIMKKIQAPFCCNAGEPNLFI